MKRIIILVAACALLFPTLAGAERKQRTDKPKKVVVESDMSRGYIEVTVYADK